MKRIYLACPYSHPDHTVRAKRAGMATYVAAHLIDSRLLVFSPLTHGHAICNFLAGDAFSWEFWKAHCLSFLHKWADELYVLALPEWEQSVGVEAEISLARSMNLPVQFLEMETSGELIVTDSQPIARSLAETKY